MCLKKDQHTNVCTHTHWMQSGGCSRMWHTHTHTCSWRAPLLPHHSMKKGCGDRHGESVWWWCGPLAGMQGVVAMVSCTAAQHGLEKRENEGGRGSQRVSRCDLCWHCMSMLKKKEKEGEGDTHLACSCCCTLVVCLPLRCAVLVCHAHTHTHTLFFSSSTLLCSIMHTVHVHACLCQCSVCSTHMM